MFNIQGIFYFCQYYFNLLEPERFKIPYLLKTYYSPSSYLDIIINFLSTFGKRWEEKKGNFFLTNKAQ